MGKLRLKAAEGHGPEVCVLTSFCSVVLPHTGRKESPHAGTARAHGHGEGGPTPMTVVPLGSEDGQQEGTGVIQVFPFLSVKIIQDQKPSNSGCVVR